MVRAECEASGSPREPEIAYYDQFPLTSNDSGVNERVTHAFVEHFGADRVRHQDPVTASEDFSRLPDAFGIPYAYWTVGGHDAADYRAAVAAGRVAQDIPANHSPLFYPVIDPTLSTMTQTHVVAALAYLGT
jgi:metal-dependent amidase/aminoacylase/carboxypeptidase family protein